MRRRHMIRNVSNGSFIVEHGEREHSAVIKEEAEQFDRKKLIRSSQQHVRRKSRIKKKRKSSVMEGQEGTPVELF